MSTYRAEEYQVFTALANHVGHDKRGNRTYVRVVYREIETREKVEDDSTDQIAERFREWL